MKTAEFLSRVHEFRSIIWFFIFLIVLALVMAYLWWFADKKDKEESSPPFEVDTSPIDQWGD